MKAKVSKSTAKTAAELVRYANSQPVILSLLYDLDLMPEQVHFGYADWARMLTVIAHMRQAIEQQSTPTP